MNIEAPASWGLAVSFYPSPSAVTDRGDFLCNNPSSRETRKRWVHQDKQKEGVIVIHSGGIPIEPTVKLALKQFKSHG